jgi:hypothetical protein
MASTTLNFSQSNGNRKTFTWSSWVKKNGLSSGQNIFHVNNAGDYSLLMFQNNDKLQYYVQDGASNQINYISNQVFRDTSAWYHFVLAVDTTQATSSDRVKIYVNGEQITSWSTASAPSQNADLEINLSGHTFRIGSYNNGGDYFNGSMSHVHFCDGTAYDASAFGETDANGVWKINTSPSVTYGTNGFFILKNGNSVTDQSGEGNNFTVAGGTLTNTEDNPSNVFATMNPLMGFRLATPYLKGNTVIENGDAQWESGYSTIATPKTGKWYAEFKYSFLGTSYTHLGISPVEDVANHLSGYLNFGDLANSWSWSGSDGKIYNSGSIIASYSAYNTAGDITGIAVDCDNSKLYFSLNGVWQNSANPSTGTNGISITSNLEYYIGTAVYNAYTYANYGNGYFGTTAVASAGTNASGIGIFEYDVPTGYTALSTKGLNL